MDLAVRASLKGWKFVYVGALKVKNELPSTLKAYRYQQHRWSCGPANLFRKMAIDIVRNKRVSLWKKCYVIYSFFFVRKIVAHVVTFVFYCVVIPTTVLVPEVEIPKWGAVYIPSIITLLNAVGTPSEMVNKVMRQAKETELHAYDLQWSGWCWIGAHFAPQNSRKVSAATHGDSEDNRTAVDFRGNPVDRSKTGGWLSAGLILGTELAERICVNGISMNLVTYLVGTLHISTSKSATLVTNFMDPNKRRVLNWEKRFEIIIGTTEGLVYLHENSKIRIIHRDIKSSNILLDSKFRAKISDFGLARSFQDDKSHISTVIAGTLGYMAPEYLAHGQLTEKADVYSFGVLLIEIVAGRQNNRNKTSNYSDSLLTDVNSTLIFH